MTIVAGNAAELRRLAEAAQSGDTAALDAAASDARVKRMEARAKARAAAHPELGSADDLATAQVGKIRCTFGGGPLWVGGPQATGVTWPYPYAGTAWPTINTTGTGILVPPAPSPAAPPKPEAAKPADPPAGTPAPEATPDRRPLNLTVDGDTSELWLYGDIDSWGGWWGISAEEVLEDLGQVTTANLVVHINSYGGEVFEGLAISAALRAHQARIVVLVDGIAASIASIIAMAGDEVVMGDPSMLMAHDPWMFCAGDATEMLRSAAVLDEIGDMLAGVYESAARGRGGSRGLAEWRDLMRGELWMNQDRAVTEKLADRVDRTEAGDDEPADAAAGRPRASAGAAPVPVVSAAACPMHTTGTTDEGSWDAGAQTGKLDAPMTKATVHAEYALYDEDRADDDGKYPKDACSLPHHVVSDDGTPGAAHLAGVRNALARLEQTSGYSEEDRNKARDHLQAHLDDGNDDDETDDAADLIDEWAATVAQLTDHDPEFDSLTEALLR